MRTAMLGLLAETPIHPGAGRGMGVVDLPVAREAATDYPVLVGSSLKGALRDKMEKGVGGTQEAQARFGKQDHAGDVLVSDARLLLLPVRSLTGSYRWATCPHLIERYCRDLGRAGLGPRPPAVSVRQRTALAAGNGELYLEERQFSVADQPPAELAQAIAPLLRHDETRNRLSRQISVLDDDDFAWFVRYGLPIQARNVLDDGTKQSTNLWYEETLSPDTVLYALLVGRSADALAPALDSLFPEDDPYLQAGGNETVGQGWFAVTVRTPKAATKVEDAP